MCENKINIIVFFKKYITLRACPWIIFCLRFLFFIFLLELSCWQGKDLGRGESGIQRKGGAEVCTHEGLLFEVWDLGLHSKYPEKVAKFPDFEQEWGDPLYYSECSFFFPFLKHWGHLSLMTWPFYYVLGDSQLCSVQLARAAVLNLWLTTPLENFCLQMYLRYNS